MVRDNMYSVSQVTISLGPTPPKPIKALHHGPSFELVRRSAGCSNWKVHFDFKTLNSLKFT